MSVIYTICSSALNLVLLFVFCESVFRNSKKKIPGIEYCLWFGAVEVLLVSNLIINNNISDHVRMIIYYLSTFLTVFFFSFIYIVKVKLRIIWALIYMVISFLCENLTSFIVNKILNDFSYDTEIISCYSDILLKIIILICVIIISFIMNLKNLKKIAYYYVIFLITPAISVFLLLTLPGNNRILLSADYTEIIYCIIGIINMFAYIFINHIENEQNLINTNSILKQQIDLQNKKYNQICESYISIRKILHDVKKHYRSIGVLIEKDQILELHDYLEGALGDLKMSYPLYDTGYLILDSILTYYKQMSQNNNIDFDVNLQGKLENIPLSDYDLSIIMGNLLDNAVEAVKNADEKKIRVHMNFPTSVVFAITIENTVDNNNLDSVKNVSEGFGILNVKRVVKKYQGVYEYYFDNFFSAAIIIPVKKEG